MDPCFHLQAKTHVCLDLVVLPVHRASSSSSSTIGNSISASYGPTEGTPKYQIRLANLLYEWTDKATDWPFFLRCDVSSPTLGVDMWNAITLKYQLHSSCDIGVHTDRLAVPQRKDESISSFWFTIQAVITHLASSVRRTTITNLADIIKLKTLPVHATWIKDIVPRTTTKRQIQEMIYNLGVHLEFKTAETESLPSTVAAFPVVDPQTEVIRLLTEHVASLTSTLSRTRDRGN